MKCPYCGHLGDKVVDSRESKEGDAIRRRRECLECGRRFTSYERIDEIPYMVVKKDGRRERFERQKLVAGLLKACEKRPVRISALEAIADKIEALLQEKPEREIATEDVGALVMRELKHLDKVAFVRFASVYRNFRDVDEFKDELNALLRNRRMMHRRVAAVVACVVSAVAVLAAAADVKVTPVVSEGRVLAQLHRQRALDPQSARTVAGRPARDLRLRGGAAPAGHALARCGPGPHQHRRRGQARHADWGLHRHPPARRQDRPRGARQPGNRGARLAHDRRSNPVRS